MLIKAPGIIVLGVNDEGAYTRYIRGLKRSEHGVFQEPGADALSL